MIAKLKPSTNRSVKIAERRANTHNVMIRIEEKEKPIEKQRIKVRYFKEEDVTRLQNIADRLIRAKAEESSRGRFLYRLKKVFT